MTAWQPERPYNALPPVHKAALETKPVLRACIEARAALAELKQATELVPNPGILINTLPLLEAQASSAIENVVTTADALYRHLDAEGQPDPATREALRYREALMEGFRSLAHRPLGTVTAELVCSRIKGAEMRVRRVPGTALMDRASDRIVYTPPEGEDRIRSLLAHWERVLHAWHDVDPLLRMAAAHYQFEAIHPFTDGNGRTGRVLNTLHLVERGLLRLPVLYMSRYLVQRRSDYYRLLLAVTTDAAWEPWLEFMLQGVEETSVWTLAKIAAIRNLTSATSDFVRIKVPKVYSAELMDVLFTQPYCRIRNVVSAGIVERQAASRYLKRLASAGVLREEAAGREKLFVNVRLLRLLTGETNTFEPFD